MKTNKMILKGLFFFILWITSSSIFGQKTVKLDVPKLPQQTNVWCWAASMEMIMKYHDKSLLNATEWQCRLGRNYYNVSYTQSRLDINLNVNSCNCANCTNSLCSGLWVKKLETFTRGSQYFDVLFSYYAYHSNEDTLRMSWNDIKKEIDNCRPFIAVLYFVDALPGGSGKHAVVVKGYEENLLTNERYVWINDPLRSCVGESTFCDIQDNTTCEFTACKEGCEYRMSYDLFNIPASSKVKDLRAVGFIHNIYPTRDTSCTSCDSLRLTQIKLPISTSANQKTNALLIDTGVTVTVRYIDYNKMLNPNFTAIRLDSYYLPITTREILSSFPRPQSKSQELINNSWKTVIIRDLKQLPKIRIKISSLNDTIVRLKNDINIEGRNILPFEYVHYTPLLYLFYRFTFNGKPYLAPTSNLQHPITGAIFAKAGTTYNEKDMITALKKITNAYEKDALLKYDKNASYTR